MKDLIKKYRHDSLSRAELNESRDHVAAMDNDRLDHVIYEDWQVSETEPTDSIPTDAQARVKRRIDAGLGLKPSLWTMTWRIMRTACVIMLPLFVIATAVLYFKEDATLHDTITVATRMGEQSTVTLPDSSMVILNGGTSLACCQELFRGDDRNIDFSGEAYFDITKDATHPFVINSRGLKVTVLGTKFNLEARPDGDCATLYLEEGLVLLTSNMTGESIEVHPREKAVLNYSDGHLTLVDVKPDDNTLAWKTGRLVFNDEPLGNVFDIMYKYYNYTLTADDEDAALLDARFTGTIPSDNITMAVAVLEKAFGTHFTMTRNRR